MKIYRGSPTAARNYLEADRSRADDYYLTEATGVAERYIASPLSTAAAGGVRSGGTLEGDAYERWVAGLVVETGAPKGRLRTDGQGVRFVEVVVNGPKTWSLVAAVDPVVATAYDAAQERAAREIIGWLVDHATTRVGPRGRQVQVPVEEIEAVVVRHYTSRAGDPHRHLHLQVNARVWAANRWRGIHTVGVRDSLEAINGIGHAAVMADPEFRTALTARGYTLDPATGEVAELAPFAGTFSARAAQIGRHVDRYEAQWRAEHPEQEPGPRLRRAWDTRAWAHARPDKVVPRDGEELARRWVEELHLLGFREPSVQVAMTTASNDVRIGALDRGAVVETVLARLGQRRSAWNAADVRGVVEREVAAAGVVGDGPVRRELAEDLTARVIDLCVPLLARPDVPEHVRVLSSPHVLDVERDLTTRLTTRAASPGASRRLRPLPGLDDMQRSAVEALTGTSRLLVIEGAAGAGKTTTLAAAAAILEGDHQRLVVVTPTRKAAAVAAGQLGGHAFSAAWLAHQYGFRWDGDGRWTREPHDPGLQARLFAGDLLLVDEAGMLDQDTARALVTIADETGARLALIGDRHQLPAVGRGGVLDLAARWASEQAHLTLETVHRFADPGYADLTLQMRTGEHSGEVFDALLARGVIEIHASEVERRYALASLATEGSLVIADTREQVADLNAAIRDHHREPGVPSRDGHCVVSSAGEQIGLGDRVATRRNSRDLDVANRDTWTVTALAEDGSLRVTGRRGERLLPSAYVASHVELAYATTVYGAQGETVGQAHLLVGDSTGAAAAYVGMTRGRVRNIAHLVADSPEDARRQWVEVFSRDRADLGPGHAAQVAADDVDRYGPRADSYVRTLQAAALRDERRGFPNEPHLPYPSAPGRSAPGIGR